MISVLILTFNEESNIAACLDSVAWSDDVVVFDSFSTDQTVRIAQGCGVRVIQHAFQNYGAQREAARTLVEYRHPWLLVLDADEQVDETLKNELLALGAEPPVCVAYRVRRKDHFMGRWIKHSTMYPTWFVRVLRHQEVHYEARSVHEYPVTEGTVGELDGHLIHFNFSKGIAEWVERHNRYSTMEALENARSLTEGSFDWRGLFTRDPVRRRRALKLVAMRLPCRPLLRFLYLYLVRRAFLDGGPGFWYCRLIAFYELMTVLKLREANRSQGGGR